MKALWAQPALLEQFSAALWACPAPRACSPTLTGSCSTCPGYHAVINAEGGEEHGNIIARVPDACAPGSADQAQAEMLDLWGSEDNRPVLLDGDVSPVAHTLWTDTGGPHVTVGRGFTVDAAPATARFDAMPGRNLAVLGAGAREEAPRVLSCAAAGLAEQGFALDLVTFEALGSTHADWVAAHAPDARMIGHCSATEYVEPYLQELRAEIEARLNGAPRPPRAVVIWEVDAAETRLGDEGRTLLKEIVHLGPEVGVHVLGWWRSVDQFLKFLMVGAATAEDFGVIAPLRRHRRGHRDRHPRRGGPRLGAPPATAAPSTTAANPGTAAVHRPDPHERSCGMNEATAAVPRGDGRAVRHPATRTGARPRAPARCRTPAARGVRLVGPAARPAARARAHRPGRPRRPPLLRLPLTGDRLMFDDGTQVMTANARRAYDTKVRQLRQADRENGGHSADDWINEQHRLFLASVAAFRKAGKTQRVDR